MEEIDLKELFLFVKSKLGLLIIITAGVCLLGCIYGLFIQKPMYESYTTVILSGMLYYIWRLFNLWINFISLMIWGKYKINRNMIITGSNNNI